MFEKSFEKYLENLTKKESLAWSPELGITLLAAKAMHGATGNRTYGELLEELAYRFAFGKESEGFLEGVYAHPDRAIFGKVLDYLYAITGQAKYKDCLDKLMEGLMKLQQEAECGFATLDTYYYSLPTYIQYETNHNEKENYGSIYMQMRKVRSLFWNENAGLYHGVQGDNQETVTEIGLRDAAYQIMALLDMYEDSSEEVFEQHKQYATWFKKVLRGTLKYRSEETGLFKEYIAGADEETNPSQAYGSAIIAGCILKGCRMGILLREKYQHIAVEVIRNILSGEYSDADSGALALAYAEALQISEDDDIYGKL